MGSFKISDKPENNNPVGVALCLVENENVPGEYYKVPVADLNKGYLNGILIDDTNKADGYILAYNQSENKFEYVENTGGGGGGSWGSITGTLSDQTDLQTELDEKTNKTTLLPAFDSEIAFDGDDHIEHNQTGAIVYTLGVTQPPYDVNGIDHYRQDIINANTDGITLPVGIDVRGDALTVSKTNILDFQFLAYKTGTIAEKTTVVNRVIDLPVVDLPPSITGETLDATNDFTDVDFSEGVYDAAGGALTAANFSITDINQNGDDVTAVVLGTVTQTGGGALTGGETTVRVNHSRTNSPSTGLFKFKITCVNFEDVGGNETVTGSTEEITLNDLAGPAFLILDSLASLTRVDNDYTGTGTGTPVGVNTTHEMTGDGYLEVTYTADPTKIGLDADTTLSDIGWDFSARVLNNGIVLAQDDAGDGFTSATPILSTSKLRIRRSGTDVIAELAVDGINYNISQTFTNSSSGAYTAKAALELESSETITDLVFDGFTAI